MKLDDLTKVMELHDERQGVLLVLDRLKTPDAEARCYLDVPGIPPLDIEEIVGASNLLAMLDGHCRARLPAIVSELAALGVEVDE